MFKIIFKKDIFYVMFYKMLDVLMYWIEFNIVYIKFIVKCELK